MNYFNFFSQYSGGKKGAGGSKKSLIAALVVAALLCGGIYGFFTVSCLTYQSQLDYLKEIKENEIFNQQHAVAVKVANQIGAAEKELAFMQLLESYTDTVSTANTGLMELIDECVFEGGYLSSINIDGIFLDLRGYAPDLDTITAIERNFRNSGKVSSVLMQTAERTESTGMVSFTCILRLNGGAILGE